MAGLSFAETMDPDDRSLERPALTLGTRLLQRNSRKLELTEAGSEFHGFCLSMMEQARAAQLAMQHRVGAIAGKLRVSVTVAVADLLLTKVMPSFLSKHPQVSVALQ